MAEAIIEPLVGRLHELAMNEARALVAVNKDIRMLRDKLMWLQAFLREADNRRRSDSDELTRVWLQQTRDAVFDAEDAVDRYYLQVDMSRYATWRKAILEFLAAFKTQVCVRHNLSSKIKDINSRLEGIIQNKDKYKLDETAKIQPSTWKASTSISDAHKKLDDLHLPRMLKRKDKRDDLEDELCSEKENLSVIYVVGESGIGKTTLVRDVCKRVKAKKHFSVQAMQSFAPHLSATDILHQIVQQLTDDDKHCPRENVKEMLGDALDGKKYLLVIDGEISSTEWTSVLNVLQMHGDKGSRIVRITQAEPEEQTDSIIKVNRLGEDETRKLFLMRLNMEAKEYREYIDNYSGDIHIITEGLPLAVVLLSGLVQTKEFSKEWTMVFNRLMSKESKRLHNLLSLCFEDLPHELKACFLYFAALPANVMIEARTLVCMWMAEGFLRPKVGKTMEKVGYRYLNELVTRNLVNLVHMDQSNPGGRFLAVQNTVHDFLQSEAHEACFVEVHSGDDVPSLTSARRLSLQHYTDNYASLASPLPKLRSIFSYFEQEPKETKQSTEIPRANYLCCSPHQRANDKKRKDIKSYIKGLFQGSEFLRVINLHGIEIDKKLPDEIGSVVHLQYLGITSCSLDEIPPSIGRLTRLQTLDVRETNVRSLPPSFWTIKTLRHVFGFVLKLPKNIGNFQHLYTLDSIKPYEDDCWAGTLAKMINLEYLCVWHISARNVKDFSDALSKLENLRTLILRGGPGGGIIPRCVWTSKSLRRLKFMVLQGEMELPSGLENMSSCFPNLFMLSLQKTNVSQYLISKLATLPSLVTLVLYSCSCMDGKLVFPSAGFRCLKNLKIDAEGLHKVKIENGALRNLEELDIHHGVKINAEGSFKKQINVVDIVVFDA